jgi:large subunit ribosomal protein L6
VSRVGNQVVSVPTGVSFRFQRCGKEFVVSSPKGSTTLSVPSGIRLDVDSMERTVHVRAWQSPDKVKPTLRRHLRKRRLYSLQGSFRAQLQNTMFGLSSNWHSMLELSGLGYSAEAIGLNRIRLSVGLSHKVEISVESPMTVYCPTPQKVRLVGPDLVRLSQRAAIIRSVRVPDAYHGKGVRWLGEVVVLKEGKKPQAL